LSTEVPLIPTSEAISRIKKLIDSKDGDEGRLRYIAETLQKGKPLFHSDQIYLNKKILAEVAPFQKETIDKTSEKIKNVKRLIALRLGDRERLHFILTMLKSKKSLYHTDEDYLQLKLNQLHEFYKQRKLNQRFQEHVSSEFESRYKEFHDPYLARAKKFSEFSQPQNISEKLQEIENDVFLQSQEKNPELTDITSHTLKINLEIDKERLEINRLKNIHELIIEKVEELSQLKILNQKYEIRINHEKEILENQIRIELDEIKTKDILIEELIKIQSQIIQIKTEKEDLRLKIKNEKEHSETKIKAKQFELEKLKNEYNQVKTKIEFRLEDSKRFFEKNSQLKGKIPSSTKGKVQVIIVAIGMILGFSGILIKLTDIWPCDILEILKISIPGLC